MESLKKENNAQRMINVLVIDNTDSIKPDLSDDGLNITLCKDEVQALNAVEKKQPSVVLLNYSVRKEQTAEYIKLIRSVNTDSKVVVIAKDLTEQQIVECLIAGAKGYQQQKQLDEYMDKLIRVIDAGEAWITRRMVAILLDKLLENN